MKPYQNADDELTPQQKAALNLLQGGTVEEFYKSIDDVAKAESLVEYLRNNPDQVKKSEKLS